MILEPCAGISLRHIVAAMVQEENIRIKHMIARTHYAASARSRILLALTAWAVAGFTALSVSAADNKPAVEPRAEELLKRMGDYLGQAQFFSVSAEIWQDVQLSSGQRVQSGRTVELRVRRPNRLRAEIQSARRNREIFYDGEAITLFNRAQNFYGSVRISGSLDDAMDAASEGFGIAIPLEDFIRSNPQKDLLQNVTSGSSIGTVSVLGVPCEHLAFTQTNIDWQIWIENGVKPVPRKFVITYKEEPDSPQFTALFTNWDLETKLPDFVFKFEPPAGASKIKVKDIKSENQSRKTEEK